MPLLKDSEAEWWAADVAAESLCRIAKTLKPETVEPLKESLAKEQDSETNKAMEEAVGKLEK